MALPDSDLDIRNLRMNCGPISMHQAKFTCMMYNDDKYVEIYTFAIERTGSRNMLVLSKVVHLKTPYDYQIQSSAFSDYMAALHVKTNRGDESNLILFYNIYDTSQNQGQFPCYTISAKNFSSDYPFRSPPRFVFVDSKKLAIKSDLPDVLIQLFDLGDVYVTIKNFTEADLKQTFVQVTDPYLRKNAILPLSDFFLTHEENESSKMIKRQEVKVRLTLLAFMLLPLILLFVWSFSVYRLSFRNPESKEKQAFSEQEPNKPKNRRKATRMQNPTETQELSISMNESDTSMQELPD